MTVMKQGDHGEPVPFRKLQHHLRQLTAGGATNALVLQALANMCREEENIVDQMTLERAEKKEHGKARTEESFSTRRFIRRASVGDDSENSDPTTLFAKYVKRKCMTSPDQEKTQVANFSVNIQQALITMTTLFSDDINEAYTSDPSQRMAQVDNNSLDVMLKISQIDSNMKFIDEDMHVLAEEQMTGYRTAVERLRGFTHLGEEDCLGYKDCSLVSDAYSADDSYDISTDDSSDDSSDDSASSKSTENVDEENGSEWDCEDESSLDTNFMAEMANELGFEVTCFEHSMQELEDDETVATVDASLMKAIASGEKSLSAMHQPSKPPFEPGIQPTYMDTNAPLRLQVPPASNILLSIESGNFNKAKNKFLDRDSASESESDTLGDSDESELVDDCLNQIESNLLAPKQLLSMSLSPSSVGGIPGFISTFPFVSNCALWGSRQVINDTDYRILDHPH